MELAPEDEEGIESVLSEGGERGDLLIPADVDFMYILLEKGSSLCGAVDNTNNQS